MARLTWKYLATDATRTYPSWTNKQVADFEYFNPNGTYAKWKGMCDTIAQFVDRGAVPSGWHLAYGSLNEYSAQALRSMHSRDRIGETEIRVTIKMLKEDIDHGYTKLGELMEG